MRRIPADAVVLRNDWLEAYRFVTDRGALALNDYARTSAPFAKVGKTQIAVEVASVVRASDSSFRIAWVERQYIDNALAATERWSAILTIVVQPPTDAERLRKNPLGIYVHAFNWTKESLADAYPVPRRAIAGLRIARRLLDGLETAEDQVRRHAAPGRAAAPIRPSSIQIVELPGLLPLPGQLKPLPGPRAPLDPADPYVRVEQANGAARVQPTRAGYINAMQVYPFSDGALYQVYAAPGEITDIALAPGEQLVGSGPVAAGDTVRWVIGDTESGTGQDKRIHILVKPTRADLATNLVINTDRRTYHLELRSTEKTYMASSHLGLCAGPAHRLAPPERCSRSRDRRRHRRRHQCAELPLPDRGRHAALASAAGVAIRN